LETKKCISELIEQRCVVGTLFLLPYCLISQHPFHEPSLASTGFPGITLYSIVLYDTALLGSCFFYCLINQHCFYEPSLASTGFPGITFSVAVTSPQQATPLVIGIYIYAT